MNKFKSTGIFLLFFVSFLAMQSNQGLSITVVSKPQKILNSSIPTTTRIVANQVPEKIDASFTKNDFTPLPASLNTHSPITIHGDNQISLYNTSGSGTPSDPYVISNLNISQDSAYLITIVNTSKTIIIRNNFFQGVLSYAINLINASNIIINNNEFNGLDEGVDATNSSNLTIENNYMHNFYALGSNIVLERDNASMVQYNNLSQAQFFAIQQSDSFYAVTQNNFITGSSDGIIMTACYFSHIQMNSLSGISDTGIDSEKMHDSFIQDNTMDLSKGQGIFTNIGSNNSILNNKITGGVFGIYIEQSSHNKYISNTIVNAQRGIMVYNDANNIIQNNIISNTSVNGMVLEYSNQNFISGNSLIGLPMADYGLYIEDSNYNFIIQNSIRFWNYSLYLSYANWNNITTTTILSCFENQTEIVHSNFNTISNTSFDTSGDYALSIDSGINNKIFLNTFPNIKYYALIIGRANETIIERNIFSGVPHYGDSQAFDGGINNIFRFNYWNGYVSPDTNGDGFVDYPFLIDGPSLSYDHYPLVSSSQIYNIFGFVTSSSAFNTTSTVTVSSEPAVQNANSTTNSSTSKASPGFTLMIFISGFVVLTSYSIIRRRKN